MLYKTEEDFSKTVKANGINGLYLLCGAEDYLIDAWKKQLSKDFEGADAFNMQRFDGRAPDVDAIYDAVEAFPFMADKKCVLVEDLDVSKLSGTDMAKFEEMLSDIPPDCVLIMTGRAAFDSKGANAKKIKKIAETNGIVAEFGARGQAGLSSFLKSRAKSNGCELSSENANKIISLCGTNMNTLSCEIEKICAFAKYEQILPEHIKAVATQITEAKVFDLNKAILAGNVARAMDILSDLFYLREEPIAVLSVLIMAYVDLYRARTAKDIGLSVNDVTALFNYKGREFRIRNAFNSRLSTGELRNCLDNLYECDRKLKSTGVNGKVLLEQTVIKLFMAKETA